jgi:hypothetical protein
MNWTKRLGKWLVVGTTVGGTCVSVGCLTRPVGKQPPTTKVNFTSQVSQQQVDKIDLLFMIDNSASMGDKQKILADAVPLLLNGLVRPKCVKTGTNTQVGDKVADYNGNKANNFNCPTGSEPEFRPVTDMHIGVISSSLGSMGGSVCGNTGRLNDKAHLLNLVKGEGPLADASPANFLSWFPTNEENKSDPKRHPTPPTPAILNHEKLVQNFQKLVVGVEQTGCGFEAQLESIYRFLIQPDPWVKVDRGPNNDADYATLGAPTDIDYDLLKQRADFLREDSLVAVIALTDEQDSSVDPLALGGQGWAFENQAFPIAKGSPLPAGVNRTRPTGGSTAPRPTSACKTNPASPDCESCALTQRQKNDPSCQVNGGWYTPIEDGLNVRFHRMKERFGYDPQYPIKRYVDGFTQSRVPDRSTEHPTPRGSYVGTPKCTNPLFAKNLPRAAGQETCLLQRSSRSADHVFFAVVGGVPHQLLHFDPNDPEKSRITSDDWNKILGRDPEKLFVWPVYSSGARARFRCPACVLVVTPNRGIARQMRRFFGKRLGVAR